MAHPMIQFYTTIIVSNTIFIRIGEYIFFKTYDKFSLFDILILITVDNIIISNI